MRLDTVFTPKEVPNHVGLGDEEISRFLQKIEVDERELTIPKIGGACWIWTASKVAEGYGILTISRISKAPLRAHRVSYGLFTGPVPAGLQIHHECRNRACVNPHHLEAVTPKRHAVDLTKGSASYVAKRTTHCTSGHEYTKENTIKTKSGKRVCRECNRIRSGERHRKFREANPLLVKTHCPNGHEFTDENTEYYPKNGKKYRRCKACTRAATDKYQRDHRERYLARRKELKRMKKAAPFFSELQREAIQGSPREESLLLGGGSGGCSDSRALTFHKSLMKDPRGRREMKRMKKAAGQPPLQDTGKWLAPPPCRYVIEDGDHLIIAGPTRKDGVRVVPRTVESIEENEF